MKLSQAHIDTIRKYLKDQPVLKAYVFGSFARGQATADSDLDILVELDYRKQIGLEFIQMKLDLEKLLRKEVDLVTPEGLSRHIRPIVDRDKVLIYAR